MRNTWQFETHDGRPLHVDLSMVAGIERGSASATVALAIGSYPIQAIFTPSDAADSEESFARLVDAWRCSEGRPDILEVWQWDVEDGFYAQCGVDLRSVCSLSVFPGRDDSIKCPPSIRLCSDSANEAGAAHLKLTEGESFEATRDAIMARWSKARTGR